MYWFTLTSLLHKNIAQRRFVKCFCSGKCKIGGLNTDLIVARDWKTSTVSFKACTGTTLEGGIEGFLDARVTPKATENLSTSGYELRSITGASQGPAFSALFIAHGAGVYGGLVFSYDGQFAQFYYFNGTYGIRRF